MKKTLLALAVIAATGTAFAQSTVSITGSVGFGYQSVDSAGSAASATTGAAAVAAGTTRGLTMTDATLAFTAVEELGGGMKATANMTFDTGGAQFNTAGNFNRRNTSIGLSGGFGSVSLANTRSGDLLTRAFVAPAALPDGIYDTSGILARAPIDILTYTTPSFSGFTGSLSYVESGAPSNAATVLAFNTALAGLGGLVATPQGDGGTNFTAMTTVLGLNYANGPLAGGLAFKTSTYNANHVGFATIARSTNTEGFLTYDFGMARVGLGFDTANAGVAASAVNDATAFSFGVVAPIGAFTVGLNWAQRDVNNMYEAVIKYDLSKRTNVNLSFGRQSSDAAAGMTDGNQYRLGLNHAF